MLFISPHVLYQMLGIIPEQDEYHPANGAYLRTRPAVNAEFHPGGAPSWAMDQALANPKFRSAWNGLPDGVDYRAYVGAFDTNVAQETYNWSDETREYVEEFLLNHQDYGTRYVLAELPLELSGKPWPQYDECHHMQVAIVAQNLGCNLHDVLEYEQAHRNRPVVVRKLEEALIEVPAPDDDLVAA